ncbi:hypothetical protein HCN44_003661 [Aphidius gifuensis]|uniref:Spermatogenesis-associated protein 6 N-terminal domain-containing protein n=1 Tax=Aphidius gifuensis TaxID=684658 RepID=A0A835CN57_APHGI|nr:spermatogenesis-associated protein 6 [Aphidius gifuensis]KAF7987798.1 hypothetical protein HCN44_003661 [Aphidius gifuensis]
MTRTRGFCVKIEFDLHAVTCPGVWLCPNGSVALQINSLNSHIESQKTNPIFPLLFDDKFLFKKIFTGICTLTELECLLEDEYLYAELIQWPTIGCKGVVLSTFKTNLLELLYPSSCFKGLLNGADVDLLMESTKYFPGIIAPKIEISTRTIVEEVFGICELDIASNNIINPKLINSKAKPCIHKKSTNEGVIRQRKVCHSYGKPVSPTIHCRHAQNHHACVSDSQKKNSHVDQCYQKYKNRSCSPSPLSRRTIHACSSNNQFHNFDDCPVCLRYKNFFSKESKQNIHDNNSTRKNAIYGICNISNCRDHASTNHGSASSILQSKIQSIRSHRR